MNTLLLLFLVTPLVFTGIQGQLPGSDGDLVPELPLGRECSTTYIPMIFPPRPICPDDGRCVLTFLGDQATGATNVGVCRRLFRKTFPVCSKEFCGRRGQWATCRTTSSNGQEDLSFCKAFAKVVSCGNPICTTDCIGTIASDGSFHCNACNLQAASCEADFKFYGPVNGPEKCLQGEEIDAFDRKECCDDYRLGCDEPGEECSTGGSLIAPSSCSFGSRCVITDFGFPAVDRPTRGRCAFLSDVEKCSVDLCAKNGKLQICRVEKQTGTCGAWADREDGGNTPDCEIICPLGCDPTNSPVGSDGVVYCNECILTRASCESGFEIYGPVGTSGSA